jgi:hypothetical protein
MKLLRRKRPACCRNCDEDIEPCAKETCVRRPAFVHAHTKSHRCQAERFAVATPLASGRDFTKRKIS